MFCLSVVVPEYDTIQLYEWLDFMEPDIQCEECQSLIVTMPSY